MSHIRDFVKAKNMSTIFLMDSAKRTEKEAREAIALLVKEKKDEVRKEFEDEMQKLIAGFRENIAQATIKAEKTIDSMSANFENTHQSNLDTVLKQIKS